MPGVYALGDCNGRGAFTHAAYNDFEIVRTGANCIGFARAGTDIAVSVDCEENDAPLT